MRVVFVHGACVKDGSWWWHPTAELLLDRGVPSEAPLLPSCGETGGSLGGLREDVAAVRAVLAASDEPTVVVAHSYGGIVAAEAAAGVHHLLLVSSYLPEVGESLSTFGGEAPAPFLDIDPDGGTFTVRQDALAETFLQDCGPEIQQQATEKTARQSLAVLEAPVRSAAWQQVAEHVPRLRRGPRHPRRAPAPVRREGRAGRRARRRPPPVPVPAGRRP